MLTTPSDFQACVEGQPCANRNSCDCTDPQCGTQDPVLPPAHTFAGFVCLRSKTACNQGQPSVGSQMRVTSACIVADMVGHTGDLQATAHACSLVDSCVKELLDTVESLGGRWLLTADHGNADDMVQRNKKNQPIMQDGRLAALTSHTLVTTSSWPSNCAATATLMSKRHMDHHVCRL